MKTPYLTQYCNLLFEWQSLGTKIDTASENQQELLNELRTKAIEQSGLTWDELTLISMCRKYRIFTKVNTYADAFDIELFEYQMTRLLQGKLIELPKYSYEKFERLNETTLLQPKSNIFVEGMYPYYFDKINAITDERIFIDVPEEIRLQRIIERDVAERGRTEKWVRYQYERDMKPMYDEFIEPLKKRANLVIDGTMPIKECVIDITKYLKDKDIELDDIKISM